MEENLKSFTFPLDKKHRSSRQGCTGDVIKASESFNVACSGYASSPSVDTITISAIPRNIERSCSTMSGKMRRRKSFGENNKDVSDIGLIIIPAPLKV